MTREIRVKPIRISPEVRARTAASAGARPESTRSAQNRRTKISAKVPGHGYFEAYALDLEVLRLRCDDITTLELQAEYKAYASVDISDVTDRSMILIMLADAGW
jgi:hypothetical protein